MKEGQALLVKGRHLALLVKGGQGGRVGSHRRCAELRRGWRRGG